MRHDMCKICRYGHQIIWLFKRADVCCGVWFPGKTYKQSSHVLAAVRSQPRDKSLSQKGSHTKKRAWTTSKHVERKSQLIQIPWQWGNSLSWRGVSTEHALTWGCHPIQSALGPVLQRVRKWVSNELSECFSPWCQTGKLEEARASTWSQQELYLASPIPVAKLTQLTNEPRSH